MIEQSRDVFNIQPNPILLDSPSTSTKRVSFESAVKVNEISFHNGKPKQRMDPKKFEVKDKTLILSSALKNAIKQKAKKFIAMVPGSKTIVLKYRKREDIDTDLRSLGLKPKTYIENIILVTGLGYKENEESVLQYFSKFGSVEKIHLEKNSKNFCIGKASITFASNINTNQEFRLNNRILRIERAKKQMINRTRIHVSHMNKHINISKFRAILKAKGFVPKNIKIDLVEGKNRGYGFVEFETTEQSEMFIECFENMKKEFGPESYAEFSKEKNL